MSRDREPDPGRPYWAGGVTASPPGVHEAMGPASTPQAGGVTASPPGVHEAMGPASTPPSPSATLDLMSIPGVREAWFPFDGAPSMEAEDHPVATGLMQQGLGTIGASPGAAGPSGREAGGSAPSGPGVAPSGAMTPPAGATPPPGAPAGFEPQPAGLPVFGHRRMPEPNNLRALERPEALLPNLGAPSMPIPSDAENPDLMRIRGEVEQLLTPPRPPSGVPVYGTSADPAMRLGEQPSVGQPGVAPPAYGADPARHGQSGQGQQRMPKTDGAPGLPERPDASPPSPGLPPTAPLGFEPQGVPYFVQSPGQPEPPRDADAARQPDTGRRATVERGDDPRAAENPLREDFPILRRRLRGKQLVWLDSAATAQKPRAVIDRVSAFYEDQNSNVHRGSHDLADEATTEYEDARKKVQGFIHAGQPEEVVFVRGCTEAINLVANTFGRLIVGEGDEILLTELEHHSNIVPWKMLADAVGARIRVAPINDRGEIKLADYQRLLSTRTRIVAFTQISNALGTVLPVEEMTHMAHRMGAYVLVDGAQSIPHLPIDVKQLDCDFFAFSGHKLFGPSGIGALYGKKALLDLMPPWQGGGSMIESVSFDEVVYAPVPAKFEAGTPILAGAVGLGAACDYLSRVGMHNVAAHDEELLTYAVERLKRIPGVRIVAEPTHRAGAVSLLVDNFEPREVGLALNDEAIAVRAGHHCAQPSLAHFGLDATVRPSFALYNTLGEVDLLCEALTRIARSRS